MKRLLFYCAVALVAAACEKDNDSPTSYTCSCDSVTGLIDYPLSIHGGPNDPDDIIPINKDALYIIPKFTLDGKEDSAGLVRFKDANQSEDLYSERSTSEVASLGSRYLFSSPATITTNIKIKLNGAISFITPTNQAAILNVIMRIDNGSWFTLYSRSISGVGQQTHSFKVDYENTQYNSEPVIFIQLTNANADGKPFVATKSKLTLEQPKDYKNVEVEYEGGRAGYVVRCGN